MWFWFEGSGPAYGEVIQKFVVITVAKFRIKDMPTSCKFLKKIYFLFKYTFLSTTQESAVSVHLSERIRVRHLTVRVTGIVFMNNILVMGICRATSILLRRTVLKVTLHKDLLAFPWITFTWRTGNESSIQHFVILLGN